MRFNNKIRKVLTVVSILSFCIMSAQNASFEKTQSFFPNSDVLAKENIVWGYLNVPENWDHPKGKKIKVAVSVVKSTSKKATRNAVVFIQGGPGAAGIQNMGYWIRHPLRKKNDIVLLDIRGTGFSEPRLCPDLGKEFMKILAKNQSEEDDEKQKSIAALSCKQDILNKNIDVSGYHSFAVSKDLHELKKQLGYRIWNVYGVSYGTHMAQVYVSEYPDDIKALLLDSSISNIATYYTKNTSNYISSLSKVFEKCLSNNDCNKEYPNLENVYYKVIEDLEREPITVSVDKKVIDSEEFTYNAEDFKIAIQQALYHKKLIEIVPLLIYQFRDRNKKALGNLVQAFSSLLNMDYGMYYCVSCNETLPMNNISEYKQDVMKYKKIRGGVSFYKSDYKVCEKWNLNRKDTLTSLDYSKLENLSFPVLVLSGEYDPITPAENAEKTAKSFYNGHSIMAPSYGHAPSFTKIGAKFTAAFFNHPYQESRLDMFDNQKELSFVSGVTINSGISSIGNSLSELNLIFLSPLMIALMVMIAFIFTYIVKLVRKKYSATQDKIIRISSAITSIIGITGLVILLLALIKVAGQNYFVLAFGLPDDFNYVFNLLLIFGILLVITLLYFILQLKKINNRSIVFSVLFSNLLLITYLFYWGIL